MKEQKIMGGAQEVCNKMADLVGDLVKLNQPVLSVEHGSKKVKVTTDQGQTYEVSFT